MKKITYHCKPPEEGRDCRRRSRCVSSCPAVLRVAKEKRGYDPRAKDIVEELRFYQVRGDRGKGNGESRVCLRCCPRIAAMVALSSVSDQNVS
jgi:hypothetical protein